MVLEKQLMVKKWLILGTMAFALSGCVEETTGGSAALDERCLQKPDPGLCKAYIPKFYFDQETQSCKQFIWGGCKGSVPFDDLDTCQGVCGK